ncbi:beta-ketoacyl synthase N-terminal-like domain-containing protein [Mucilaginibacter flavus]|uniref:beta-ketoacyl synthase N-terminal-like domain-containing protein n=1 Tax=Mucilaginibacter flavus TaxID=931504 RepID=UPI0025B527D3|nr:beta-ketoacyl synthase N-terminal-like domain-containing protein [Mucilaginibacter flavus]MDN3583554.1 beta-ketoacyl synthase N-terminal-like domain-containing protein [Mucilaginibacter flavus]
MYIRSTGNISPQKTFGNAAFPAEVVAHEGNRLNCITPDYKELIDPKLIRRMSRVIKMGVASAIACLNDAGVSSPDAIITGTAYGCLEDTGVFLSKMAERGEEMLTPTSFIQSTHNTIAAQVALLIGCHEYNNTFVSGGASFEHALLDARMMLQEGAAKNILVGGVDEITDISHGILSRFGLYKQGPVSNLDLFSSDTKGTIAGEGSAFFLVSNEASGNDLARLDAVTTFYKPKDFAEVESQIEAFLAANGGLSMYDISLVITGDNGDAKNDEVYHYLENSLFNYCNVLRYKHLCGEYPTSSAFALWYAVKLIGQNTDPATAHTSKIKKILIYNHYLNTHHSLMLLSAC